MSWVNWLSLEIVVPGVSSALLLWISVTICHRIPLRMNRGTALTPEEPELERCIG